jgi:hypothetical protein
MPRKTSTKIEFDGPATIAELIEALEDLRAQVGPKATPRVAGFIEFNANGPRVKAISAEPLAS